MVSTAQHSSNGNKQAQCEVQMHVLVQAALHHPHTNTHNV
jgi:hypothetical protein